MFQHLQNPRGGPSLLASGIALLALGGMSAAVPLPGMLIVGAALGLAGIVCIALWWKARQSEKYDLNRLFDTPPAAEDQPFRDHIPADEETAPYCGWCDEAYPPGTRRCTHCNREL